MRTVGWIPPVKEEIKAKAVVINTAVKAVSEETGEVKKATKKKKVED